MKKIASILTILLAFSFCVFAQEAENSANSEQNQSEKPYKQSEISYKSKQIYKILDHKEVYIIIYPKSGLGVGSLTIPKKWYKESPKKLKFRVLPKGMQSYMSVFTRNGEFDHVILTVPPNRSHQVWGVADSNAKVDDAEKDSLSLDF